MTATRRVAVAIWGMVTLCIAGIFGMNGLHLRAERTEAYRRLENDAARIVRGAEAGLNRSLLGVDLLLAGIGDTLAQEGVPERNQRRVLPGLRALVSQNLMVRELCVLSRQGQELACAHDGPLRTGMVLPSGFVDAVMAQPFPTMALSDPANSRASGEAVLYLARPLLLAKGEKLMVVAEVPAALLSAVMDQAAGLEDLSISLERTDGRLLVTAPLDPTRLGRRLQPPLATSQADGMPRRASLRTRDAAGMVASRPTLDPSLIVSIGIPTEKVDAELGAETRVDLSICTGVGLLLIGLAALLHRHLTQQAHARMTIDAAHAEMARMQHTLDQALDAMSEGFAIFDAEDRLILWNRRYLEIFPYLAPVVTRGVSSQLLGEAAISAYLPDGTDDERRAFVASFARRRGDLTAPFDLTTPAGREMQISVQPIAKGGKVALYTDVTQMRASARALEESRDAAQAAARAKSQFLAVMSHEIRTPLNAISGMTFLMKRDGLPDRQAARLAQISAAGQHLLAIIDSVLDLSKIDAGKLKLESRPLSLVDIVERTTQILSDRARAKGVTLATDVADPAYTLLGDATRLQQLLLNYASNALKFTETGSVTVRVRVQDASGTRVRVRLDVEDTGIGIDPQELPRLFGAFEQADTSSTRRHEGTGLGLAINKHLAELMGGGVGANSCPGAGSVFWATVQLARSLPVEGAPSAPKAAHADAHADKPPPQLAGRSALVAEDDPINQEIVVDLLRDAGMQVSVVTDGLQAVQAAAAQAFDVILMDLRMPGMDGLTATQRIRAGATHCHTPVVAVTANAFEDDRQRCLDAGMADFVTKPIDPAALYAALVRVTGRAAAAERTALT